MFNSICRLLPPKVDNSGRLPTRSASWRCIGTQVIGRQQYRTITINGTVHGSSNYCARLLVIQVRNGAPTWLRCAPACTLCPRASKHFRHVGKSNPIFTVESSDGGSGCGGCTKREEIFTSDCRFFSTDDETLVGCTVTFLALGRQKASEDKQPNHYGKQ